MSAACFQYTWKKGMDILLHITRQERYWENLPGSQRSDANVATEKFHSRTKGIIAVSIATGWKTLNAGVLCMYCKFCKKLFSDSVDGLLFYMLHVIAIHHTQIEKESWAWELHVMVYVTGLPTQKVQRAKNTSLATNTVLPVNILSSLTANVAHVAADSLERHRGGKNWTAYSVIKKSKGMAYSVT